MCARACVCGCARTCAGMWSGEGCRGRPAVVPPTPATAGSPAQGQPHPGCQGRSRVSETLRDKRDRRLGRGRTAQRPWGSALVTQSESVSGPQPHCWPGGGGSGVRGRGWLSRKARFHPLLPGWSLRRQDPRGGQQGSPGAGQGPRARLERKLQVWVVITQPTRVACQHFPVISARLWSPKQDWWLGGGAGRGPALSLP